MTKPKETTNSVTLTRAQKLTLIYRHMHRDFKGRAGPLWGEHAGKKTILAGKAGATVLMLLDDMTDEQIADALPYALKKEAARIEQRTASRNALLSDIS